MAAEPNAKSWRMGVTAKLAIAFCALLVCCAGLGVFALNRLDDVEASARDLGGHWLQTTRALGDVAYLGQRFRVIEAAVLLAPPEGKAAERKTLAAIRADVEAAFARQAQNLRSAEEKRGLDDAQSAWSAYLALDDRFLAAGAEDAARLYRTQMRDSIHTFQDAVKAAIQRNVAGADAAARASEANGEAGKRDLVAGFAILALICVAIGWRLQGSIVRPVRALTSAMTGLAEGALDVDVPGLNRVDEIGDMARASAVFRDAARQRRADLEAEADAQRQAAHQARDAEQATRERADRTQREAMQALGAALGALAKGDMLRRLDADFPAEFGDLRDDYERARETLGSALSAVVAASTALAQEHRALDRSAEELSSRTERQAANLEQSAAALQEITTAVKTSSESASEARAAVHSTKTQAERGADVAAEAIAAMDGLAQSAKEIREITSLIDEIAFQTSLLALNAGVEAARAG
jgi:methyl-accepting chemotaxis protein